MSLATVNTREVSEPSIGVNRSEEQNLGDSSPFPNYRNLPPVSVRLKVTEEDLESGHTSAISSIRLLLEIP